ncbi:hypothetical protein ACO0QE_001179 [Hanseniaspora vineae]
MNEDLEKCKPLLSSNSIITNSNIYSPVKPKTATRVTLHKTVSDANIYSRTNQYTNLGGTKIHHTNVLSSSKARAKTLTGDATNFAQTGTRPRSSTLLPTLTIPTRNITVGASQTLRSVIPNQHTRNKSQALPMHTNLLEEKSVFTGDNIYSPLVNTEKELNPLALHDKQTAYPNGPIKVIEPNIYLCSQASELIASDFDLVINVAEELPELTSGQIYTTAEHKNNQPVFLHKYWNHDTEILDDLPSLTALMHTYAELYENNAEQLEKSSKITSKREKKVLVYCQCGVSRSASLIVAYYMRYYRKSFQEAYKHIQSIATSISPNMNLICQLSQWDSVLKNTDYTPMSSQKSQIDVFEAYNIATPLEEVDDGNVSSTTLFTSSSKSSPMSWETPATPVNCALSTNPFLKTNASL